MNLASEIKQTFKQGSIVTRIIYINLTIFLVVRLIYVFAILFNININLLEWLALPSNVETLLTRPWTLITYMFLHFEFLHLFFNLLWLYWFGKIFLMYFDEKKFIGAYFFGGLIGGLIYVVSYNFFPYFAEASQNSILMGASASIISIVVATAIYRPNLELNLVLISSIFGPVKIIWIAIISVVMYALGVTSTNAGGNLAHLGGALWGFIYIGQLRKGRDITSYVNNFILNIDRVFRRKSKLRVSYRNNIKGMSDLEYNKQKKKESDNINSILDKIGKSGYDSLTKNEKELLFKMSNRKKN